MSYEGYCTHCNEETTLQSDWPYWWLCPACQADGHTTGQHEPCPICDKAFSDAMRAISDGVNERVIREGLICVKNEGCGYLSVGDHYKVIACHYIQIKHYVTVVNDEGREWVYSADCFRPIGRPS